MRGTLTGSDLARIRQGCYRVLASGFERPSPEGTEQIQAGIVALEGLGLEMFAFAPQLRRWDQTLAEAESELVSNEFVRLFGSGMDGAVCPPIESQHLGVNLAGDPARHAGRIEDLMRRSGFETRNDDRPPDHIATELELASAMCGSEAVARSAGDPVRDWLGWQNEIITVLNMWVSGFAATLAERDRSGVYAGLGEATAAFALHEHDVVRVLTGVAQGAAE